MAAFRWGILGPGTIAHKFADALAGAPDAVLHAVGSRDEDRAAAFAARHADRNPGRIRTYGDYEALAADPDLDAVYIATPHPMHAEHTQLCLERGIPVLVEKPMAIDAASERRMADTARRKGVFLMEAMWSRFLPATRLVRSLLDSGRIGEPRLVSADMCFSLRRDPAHRVYDPQLAGGGILDVGIYLMAFTSLVFGAHPLAADGYVHIGPTGVDEEAAVLLRYDGDKMASLCCAIRAFGANEGHILGTDGRIDLSPFWGAQSVRIADFGGEEVLACPFDINGFEYEIREAMDCIRGGRTESPELPLSESIAMMDILDGLRRKWGYRYPMEQ